MNHIRTRKRLCQLLSLLLLAALLTGSALALDLPLQTQAALTITGVPDGRLVRGDQFTLRVTGGSGTGSVTWTVVDGPATISVDGTVTIEGEGEITIRAEKAGDGKYAAAAATITFSTDGVEGFSLTFHISDSSSYSTSSGILPRLPDLADLLDLSDRDGLTFAGWYLDPEYTVEFDLHNPILGDLTLYAKWVPAQKSSASSLLDSVLAIFR